jgi:hypothetical protein
MSELKIKGRVTRIDEPEKKTETFTLRTFVIETIGQYPNPILFQLTQDRCDLIYRVEVGEEITVHFDIRGNEVKSGAHEGRVFNNLNAWKIDRSISVGTAPPPASASMPDDDFPEHDTMPF